MSKISPGARMLVLVGVVVIAALLMWGCAAGDARFDADTPAGFWVGLWHGMISFIALIVGLFHGGVEIYERNNTGGWYDFGFLLGVSIVWGSGHHTATRRSRSRYARRDQKEWEELGRKVQAKLERKLREWADAEPNEEWDVVEVKAEEKLKQKIREWAEEPDSPTG